MKSERSTKTAGQAMNGGRMISTGRTNARGYMQVKVAHGNFKLGKDTLIINMTSATDCPAKALGQCKLPGKCYAMQAEVQYPQVLPARRYQEKVWDETPSGEIALQIMEIARSHRKHEIKYLRFSEAGDFRTQADVDKLVTIAAILGKHGLKVYGYTARHDLDYSNRPENLTINGSGFMVDNQFTAVAEPSTRTVCPGTCSKCTLCKVNRGLEIEVKIHGTKKNK